MFCTIINQDLETITPATSTSLSSKHKLLEGFDKGLFTGMILTDRQKAFHKINHELLPGK